MSSVPAIRRRRTTLMITLSVVGVLLLGALLAVGGLALARYEGGKDTSVNAQPLPVTAVGMLATVDDLDRLATVTILVGEGALAGDPVRGGGSIVSVPISADSLGATASDGTLARQSLEEVYATAGPEGLLQAVESTLSLTVDQWVVADPGELATLLRPIAPVRVTLPEDAVDSRSGTDVTVQSAGDASLSAEQVAEVLNARADGQTDAERRANVVAVWKGVAATIGEGTGQVPAGEATSFNELLAQIYAGKVLARGLQTVALPEGDVEAGRDVELIDRGDEIYVFATIAPASLSAVATGLVYKIVAPPGYDEKVLWTVNAILYLRANVIWVDQNGPIDATTKVLLADKGFSDDVASAELLFGDNYETDVTDTPFEGIDVIIQLGTDFLDDPTTGQTLPSTTTTTTQP